MTRQGGDPHWGSDVPAFVIRLDDLSGDATQALLTQHLASMHADSPPGQVFALDLSQLKAPCVTVWSAWDGRELAGIGALKEVGGGVGELKSMRTATPYLRKGVAAALLEHILGEARRRGLRRLSLETGSGPAFTPALSFYQKHGFVEGEAFADYKRTDFNRFLHLTL